MGDIFAIYFNFASQKSLRKDTEYSSPAFSLQDSSYWADEETISHSQRLVYSQWKKKSGDPTSTKILFLVKNFWVISTLWFYKELFRVIHFDKIRFFAIYQEVLNLALSGMRRIQNTVQGPWKLKKRGFKKFVIFSVGHFLPRNFGKVWCYQ